MPGQHDHILHLDGLSDDLFCRQREIDEYGQRQNANYGKQGRQRHDTETGQRRGLARGNSHADTQRQHQGTVTGPVETAPLSQARPSTFDRKGLLMTYMLSARVGISDR